MPEIIEVDAKNENASAFLEPYIQSGSFNFLLGSGASFPAIKTAGDIEAEINAELALGHDDVANAKSLAFIEAIGDVHRKIKAADAEIEEVVSSYSRFASTIDGILFDRKSLLLPRQATVFTTNYDLFLEHAASLLPGLILNDGFDRTASLESAASFAPERYFDRTYRSGALYGRNVEIPTINLVKLHGSMSWKNLNGEIVFDSTVVDKLNDGQKADAPAVQEFLSKHFLILPNLRKFHAALMERVYYDLLRIFAKSMDQENAVLIAFGFSFCDEHILDITRRSLRNPTSQLIIVAYDKPSVAAYESKFSKHRNVTILTPAAGAFINFTRLNDMLAAVRPRLVDAD